MILATANIHSTDDVYFTVDTDAFLAELECISHNQELTDALGELFLSPGYIAEWRAIREVACEHFNCDDDAIRVDTGWSGNQENMLESEIAWAIVTGPNGDRIAFTGDSPIGNATYSDVWDVTGETAALEFPATTGRFQCTDGHSGELHGSYVTVEGRNDSVRNIEARNYDPEWVDLSWAYVECPVVGCVHTLAVGVDT